MLNKKNVIDYLKNRVTNHKVIVVGDIMLDRYFYGNVTRISPEAPVPVTLIKEKKNVLGGAANVANNLKKMGVEVFLVGGIANDHHGRLLMSKLNELHINIKGVGIYKESTTTKSRIIGGHQQMIRIDFEETNELSGMYARKIVSDINDIVKNNKIDAIIISDYGKGVCTNSVCKEIMRLDIPCFIDPKGDDWSKYNSADFITPNIKEIEAVIGREIKNETEQLSLIGKELLEKYHLGNIIITRSEKGLSVFNNYNSFSVPTVAHEVYDVSGAGDTVIAAFVTVLIGGFSIEDSAVMANIAAGIGCGKVGTYAVSRKEIIDALE